MRKTLKSQLVPVGPSSTEGVGSLDFLLEEERNDKSFARTALLTALLLHIIIFSMNWPGFSSAQAEIRTDHRRRIHPLRRYRIPPPRPPQEQPRHRVRRVQIPDPDPQAPEPLLREEAMALDEWPEDTNALPIGEFPAAPVEDEAPVQVNTRGLLPPRVLRRVEPVYPPAALKIRAEDFVVLELIINTEGAVQSVKALREAPWGMTDSAIKAAREWVFEPSTLNGRPVSIRYQLTIRFHIS